MDFKPYISLPKNINPTKKYPLILTLHGMGSNEKDIFPWVESLIEDAIIFSLRGPLQLGSGYAFFQIHRIGFPVVETLEDVISGLKELIETLPKFYPIDPERIFLVGFSQGSIVSMSFALKHSHLIKGVVALHGYIPQYIKDKNHPISNQNLSILIAQGETDPMFGPKIGEDNQLYFKERLHDVTFKMYPHGHHVSTLEQHDLLQWIKERFNSYSM